MTFSSLILIIAKLGNFHLKEYRYNLNFNSLIDNVIESIKQLSIDFSYSLEKPIVEFLAKFNLTIEDSVTKLTKALFKSDLKLAEVLNFLELPITNEKDFEVFLKRNAKKSVNSCVIQSILENFRIQLDSLNTSWVEVETLERRDKRKALNLNKRKKNIQFNRLLF